MRRNIIRYLECLYKKTKFLTEVPTPLADKVIVCGGLLILFLIVGIFTAIFTSQMEYLLFAGVLSVFLVGKIHHLVNIIRNKNYESMEGIVLKISGRHGVLHWMRVSVASEGEEFSLWLNKGVHLKKGREYRFFFEKAGKEQKYHYRGDMFLGVEEI